MWCYHNLPGWCGYLSNHDSPEHRPPASGKSLEALTGKDLTADICRGRAQTTAKRNSKEKIGFAGYQGLVFEGCGFCRLPRACFCRLWILQVTKGLFLQVVVFAGRYQKTNHCSSSMETQIKQKRQEAAAIPSPRFWRPRAGHVVVFFALTSVVFYQGLGF